ncbi:MAG: amidohydrolase [Lachnospiraceae bacterium]|nr:amidohydrolase [Lachnospiraceae bacterium]
MGYIEEIERKRKTITELSDYVWDNPETAFTEFKSAAYIEEALKAEGFTVEDNLADIKTAFKGTFGSGYPVIGILGEFDSLSGLEQESGKSVKSPDGHSCGHGCGHNLIAGGTFGAVLGIKKYLEESGKPGTVIYFGCPGEEGGSGKTFMAGAGVFDGTDVALTYHPSDISEIKENGSLANVQVLYKFDGVAAHAGAKPHLGRSALDAVELMNTGANFLREHIIQEARLHYAITDAGGYSPNVVQAHAEVLYLIRAPKTKTALEIYERVNDIAKGAALMTGTSESHDFIKACSDTILNDTLQRVFYQKITELGIPVPDEASLKLAKEITENSLMDVPHDLEHPLHYELEPYKGYFTQKYGSTDVGDVSYICPTAQFYGCSVPFGAPGHSWQWTTFGKQPYAYEMEIFAAKAMAATAAELYENTDIIEAAKKELREKVPEGYHCPIPKGIRPRSMTSFLKK